MNSMEKGVKGVLFGIRKHLGIPLVNAQGSARGGAQGISRHDVVEMPVRQQNIVKRRAVFLSERVTNCGGIRAWINHRRMTSRNQQIAI